MPKHHKKPFCRTQPQIQDHTSDINEKLILHLHDLNHTMRALYEGKISQKRILILLSTVETITQRDLTTLLRIRPGSASEVLSKLEKSGLICRTLSETDRRTTNITLTGSGKQLALEAIAQRSQRHTEMFSCLSEEEKNELLFLLEKIRDDWDQRFQTGGRHK